MKSHAIQDGQRSATGTDLYGISLVDKRITLSFQPKYSRQSRLPYLLITDDVMNCTGLNHWLERARILTMCKKQWLTKMLLCTLIAVALGQDEQTNISCPQECVCYRELTTVKCHESSWTDLPFITRDLASQVQVL